MPLPYLQLPVGFDNFAELVREKISFVDKTLFIKELLDRSNTKVALFTRPRRFGKTLNLSMLHYFFAAEAYHEKTAGLFDGLKISQAGDQYMEHQGKYPVIFVTFKDIKDHKFSTAYMYLRQLMGNVYDEHRYLMHSDKLDEEQKEFFSAILSKKVSEDDVRSAIATLSQYLFLHYGKKVWILIDEYDTPIQASYVHGYYDEMINFMRGMFGMALKTNPYLHRSVITGILRIAKESLFSGLNNLEVYSMLRAEYSEYFGFTEEEVKDLLIKAELEDKSDEMRDWYNGYKVGNTIIYNPWSAVHFINRRGEAEPYWVNTSNNDLIKELIIKSSDSFKTQIERLLNDQSIEGVVNEDMVFGDLRDHDDNAMWSLMFMSGYLRILECTRDRQGLVCKLDIPNYEVRIIYQQTIEQWLTGNRQIQQYNELLTTLLDGNIPKFTEHFARFMERTVSYHDFDHEPESFYHGLLIGLTASLYGNPNYEITSNRESGYGRYDYLIFSHDSTKPTIVIELKRVKKPKNVPSDEEVEKLLDQSAAEALTQIEVQNYVAEAKNRGRTNILKIGLAFLGKEFRIRT